MRTGLANPLEQLSLDELRQRTSIKWRTHPADVLPLWVAEMDVPLAEPVQRVLHDAVARGDTGYPAGTGYAEALAAFAARADGASAEDAAVPAGSALAAGAPAGQPADRPGEPS